ncbi:MAG: signal peptidase I [Treponema sp.]|nr:signal peptidase I [Spirochaetia bacterium]MDD7014898.1 signal peptidase I [Spirochaetales bacterium]MDY4901742.1 signal peptidase I [Treponema sp.]
MKKQLLPYIVIGIFAGICVKLFALDILKVKGDSMNDSIKNGDIIFVSKLNYGLVKPFGDKLMVKWNKPETGEIVTYLYQNNIVVKRCAGTEGDKIKYAVTDDNKYTMEINGKTYPLTEHQYHDIYGNSEVPKGMILAIGDNYNDSFDSRNYGFIPEENVIGKVLCR